MPSDLFVLKKLPFASLAEGRAEYGVFAGTREECEQFAVRGGYEWRSSRRYDHGGFWYRKQDGSRNEPSSLLMTRVA